MQLGRNIDADGHILEPPELWQKNLEAKFKDRALGLARDENGVESFIVDGHFSAISRGLGIAAAFGQPGEVAFSNEFSYMDGPPGAYEPHARVKLLDEEGIDAAVLYPTLGLLWEGEVNDPELAMAYCRVYNDWITEFCSPYPNRLYPVAHISLMDVDRAVAELKRVAKKGAKGVMLTPWPANGKAYGDTSYDPFWAVAQDLGTPVGLHVIARPSVEDPIDERPSKPCHQHKGIVVDGPAIAPHLEWHEADGVDGGQHPGDALMSTQPPRDQIGEQRGEHPVDHCRKEHHGVGERRVTEHAQQHLLDNIDPHRLCVFVIQVLPEMVSERLPVERRILPRWNPS